MKTKLKKQLFFLALFSIIGFVALQIPFTKLMGSNVSFTLFDFFGPMAGAFLGPVFGIISVFVVEVFNLLIKQTPLTTGVVIRLFPTLFATAYFALYSKKNYNGKLLLIIPVLAILIFNLNANARGAWYLSLYWLIPVVAYFKRNNLYIRSLGSTFTAHAVGGAAWAIALNLPTSVWKMLVPVVAMERLLFASGIAVSYLVMKYALKFLISKKLLPTLESITPSFK